MVTHYEDFPEPSIHRFARRYPKDIRIINVQRNPISVTKDIDKCTHVVSSSLHGCIVADALGIPNRWMVVSDRVLGKGFKFKDYYASLDLDRAPIVFYEKTKLIELVDSAIAPPLEKINEIQSSLRKQFLLFKSLTMKK